MLVTHFFPVLAILSIGLHNLPVALQVDEGAPCAGRERGEQQADAESGVSDEEELLREAEVLAAVDQEQRDRQEQPHRHRRDGGQNLQHLRKRARHLNLQCSGEVISCKVY